MLERKKVKRYGPGGPSRRVLLVAPRQPDHFWSLAGAVDLFGFKTLMPNSALATLMALTPPEVNVEYELLDENVAEIDWDRVHGDLAAVTGTTVHQSRIETLCRAFRERGLPVALGGPYASVDADRVAGLADHHFIGEAEYTWPRFLKDWFAGRARTVYRQDEPVDIHDSPPPDWSLIHGPDYMVLNAQTSRGCPHRCDFCDVVRYMGRGFRTKTVDQVLVEIKNAHAAGGRTVFFSDDNFLGRPSFSKELLRRTYIWNRVQTRPLSFSTQITVNAADDPELMELMARCRLSVAFIGVESVRTGSLAEVHKTQNQGRDNVERIREFGRWGILPFVGLVVGFDHDDADVFDEIYEFLDHSLSPVVSLSLLNAPKGTPLYDRMAAEGRLIGDDWAGEWHAATNVVPRNMTYDQLVEGRNHLFRKIYQPRRFENLIEKWLEAVEYFSPLYANKKTDYGQMLGLFRLLGYVLFQATPPVRRLFWRSIRYTIRKKPGLMRRTIAILAYFRHYHDYAHGLTDRPAGSEPVDKPAQR